MKLALAVSAVILGSIKSDNYLNLSDRYISVILDSIIFILDLLSADMKITYHLQNTNYNSNIMLNAMNLIISYYLSRCF